MSYRIAFLVPVCLLLTVHSADNAVQHLHIFALSSQMVVSMLGILAALLFILAGSLVYSAFG